MIVRFDRDQSDWSTGVDEVKNGREMVPYPYPDGALRPFVLDKIVLHWGGGTDPDGPADTPDEAWEIRVLRGWQNYHIGSKGWTDIAYGFGVGNTGLRYRLRGLNRQGATSGDFDGDGIPENSEALALVWVGGAAGIPTEDAYRSMAFMILDVFEEYGEVPVTVHQDHKATACPGPEWITWAREDGWEDYRAEWEGGDSMTCNHEDLSLGEMRECHSSPTMPDWAVAAWEAYVEAGGSNTPESAVWPAYRYDLSILWDRTIRPLQERVAANEKTIEALGRLVLALEARVEELESRPPGEGGTPTEPFDARIIPT